MELSSPKKRVEPKRELDRLAKAVIGAAIEVHKELGPGYVESVYEQALSMELEEKGIPYVRQPKVEIGYKGKVIGEVRLDMMVKNSLIVEIKAVEALSSVHTAQLISYLKATGKQLGLLINFNVPVLRDGIKRIINS